MKFSWSMISIGSRFIAQGIGIVQTILIVKLLTRGDYGLVGLVMSIGAVVGVYQNLGISSASTREISAAKTKKDAFKVFIGSLFVRYAVSLPLSLGLFVLAPYLGNVYYSKPSIISPLKIFALVIFIQALQSVLTSSIQGSKRFKFLFSFQVFIALLSPFIYLPLVEKIGFYGYFYALLIHNVIWTAVLALYFIKLFKTHIELPTYKELISIIKAVFSIGIFVYLIKILFTQWQRLGPVVLGNVYNEDALGIFVFALMVTSKIITISDAVTDVSLPSMTEVFEKSRDNFRSIFLSGNSKAFLLLTFASVLLILLKRDIFNAVDFVTPFVGDEPLSVKYADSFVLMDPLVVAFWAYSHLNLLKSGLAVPTKNLWGALFAYGLMFVLTVAGYSILDGDPMLNFVLAMAVGALVGYIFLVISIKSKVGFYPVSKPDLVYVVLSILIVGGYYLGIQVYLLVFVYFIATYFVYAKYLKNNYEVEAKNS